MAGYLAPHVDVVAYDPRPAEGAEGVRLVELDEVLRQGVIILAVPVQKLEGLLTEIGPRVRPDALVVDVASVKTVPVELMLKYLPSTCEILATHPLFGPQSGAEGIVGLTVATWPVRVSEARYGQLKRFLGDTLKLDVHEVSPDEHDREMAYVHALTFLLGKAFSEIDIPDTPLKTNTYQHLLDVRRIVESDTPELFETIQKFNPYAAQMRERFVREFDEIEAGLGLVKV